MKPGLEGLQPLLDGLPVAACVLDGDGFLFGNARLAALTGWSIEELRAAPSIWPFVAPEERAHSAARNRARLRGEPVAGELDLMLLRPDGDRQQLRVHVARFPLAGPEALFLTLTKSTGQEHTARLIRGLLDAATAAQAARAPGEVLDIARERLGRLGEGVMWARLSGEQLADLGASGELAWVPAAVEASLGAPAPLSAMPVASAARDSPEGILVDDFGSRMAFALGRPRADVPLPEGTFAVAAAVREEGVPTHLLVLSGRAFDAGLSSAFGLFARQVGTTIDTSNRLAELGWRNRELLLLNRVARASATLGSGRALQTAVERLAADAAIDGLALFRLEEEGLVLAEQAGFDEAWVRAHERAPVEGDSPWSQACRRREPVLFAEPPGGQGYGIAAPLLSSDQLQGALVAVRRGQRYSADDQRLLATIGAQLAVGLQNAALFRQAQQRVAELSRLLDLGQAVAGSLDSQEILAAGARAVESVLRCSAVYVFLCEGPSTLRCAALHDPARARPSGPLLLLERSPGLRRAIAASEPLVVEDPYLRAEFACRTLLLAPMTVRDRTLGLLVLLERGPERVFESQDLRLALHAAQLLAGSVENASLYGELRESYEKLERTQAELVDRERLAALGELSASIAHEVRNPLGVVVNALGSLRRLLKPQGQVELLLGIIGEEASRLNSMVGDLLDYSRPLSPELKPVALRPLVDDALAATRRAAPTEADGAPRGLRVEVSTQIPAALLLRADPRLLRQALVNLLNNALQATPEGGRVALEATQGTLLGRPAARLLIQDSGPGVAAGLRSRIFQPFFTTKPTGTGLGLAVVRRIVEGHGGRITVIDTGKPGACFELLLPLE